MQASTSSSPLFEKLSVENAYHWLVTTGPNQALADFLKVHGHRCIRETELSEKTWAQEPRKLIAVLQSVVQLRRQHADSKAAALPRLTEKQLLSQLQSPLNAVGRFILKKILPYARSAVAEREWGKSTAIGITARLKIGYQLLASALCREGVLPDEDLLYFLTHFELQLLTSVKRGNVDFVQRTIQQVCVRLDTNCEATYSIQSCRPNAADECCLFRIA